MAARRGKSQARRNNGGNSDGIPGWAWMVLGVLLTVVVIIVAPKYLKSGGDGFFRPQPNPDARPAPVGEDEEAVAHEDAEPAPKAGAGKGRRAREPRPAPEYQFYDLLPGKEVPLSDAELAASERAEAQRQAARRERLPAPELATPEAAAATAPARSVLPTPVDDGGEDAPAGPPARVAVAGPRARDASVAEGAPGDTARYLLQAGAFQASGQAEALKARIALLGLGARVEATQIDGKTLYRVRLGPYGTASDLADAKRTLAAGGVAAMAIRVK